MKTEKHGVIITDCKAGLHTDVIDKPCNNNSCPIQSHKYCRGCGKYVGDSIDGVVIN